MSEINYEVSYLKCIQTFNNVLPKLLEDIEVETSEYKKATNPRERGAHLAERTILIGKVMMLDQMLCFMFHELGMEVEKDDYKKRFGEI